MSPIFSLSAYATAFGLLCMLTVLFHRRTQRRLPPGPPGLPLLGNILDVPGTYEWFTYHAWGRKYESDIIHYRLFGTHVIVLNSAKAAQRMLEQQSAIFSDRFESVMLHELTGWSKDFAFAVYGNSWRERRKLFHQHFRPKTIPLYHSKAQRQVGKLLGALLNAPQDFISSISHMTSATVFDIVYGVEMQSKHDRYMQVARKAIHAFDTVSKPGQYLVDFFPALKYMPSWLPGTGFKRLAQEWRVDVDEMFYRPFQEVKAAVAAGEPRDCIASTLIADAHQSGLAEDVLIDVTGTAFVAGSETTSLVLTVFVMTMLLFPEVQKKAQQEIDDVTAGQRLPTLKDRESIPYITALLNEVLRWGPVGPIAIPHKSTEDGECDGFFIPAGSMIVPNVWSILRDESRYPDPDTFNPTRFLTAEGALDPEVPSPVDIFGYGRRICPGRHFAVDVIWLTMASLLSVVAIGKPVDNNGDVVEPSGEFTGGLTSSPMPFKATFTPRTTASLDLILRSSSATLAG